MRRTRGPKPNVYVIQRYYAYTSEDGSRRHSLDTATEVSVNAYADAIQAGALVDVVDRAVWLYARVYEGGF